MSDLTFGLVLYTQGKKIRPYGQVKNSFDLEQIATEIILGVLAFTNTSRLTYENLKKYSMRNNAKFKVKGQ